MIGGLSFFAVITGWITTEFVTRAQRPVVGTRAPRRSSLPASVIQSQLAEIREQLRALSPEPGLLRLPSQGIGLLKAG